MYSLLYILSHHYPSFESAFRLSVHPFIVFCQGEYAIASITRRMHDNQLMCSIDIISSIWSCFKPIESLQACISKALLHHQRFSLKLMNTLVMQENWLAEILWLSWLCFNKTCHSLIQICLNLEAKHWTLRHVILRRHATSLRRLPTGKGNIQMHCVACIVVFRNTHLIVFVIVLSQLWPSTATNANQARMR